MIEDIVAHPGEVLKVEFPEATRDLRVQVIRDVLWYRGDKDEPVTVVLVRDPAGEGRDEALVATDPDASTASVITGYCRRWSVELAFFEASSPSGCPSRGCVRSGAWSGRTRWRGWSGR